MANNNNRTIDDVIRELKKDNWNKLRSLISRFYDVVSTKSYSPAPFDGYVTGILINREYYVPGDGIVEVPDGSDGVYETYRYLIGVDCIDSIDKWLKETDGDVPRRPCVVSIYQLANHGIVNIGGMDFMAVARAESILCTFRWNIAAE